MGDKIKQPDRETFSTQCHLKCQNPTSIAKPTMNKNLVILTIAFTAATTAVAQHSHNHQHQQHGHSPYSGFQSREIKALSQQQIDDLRAGKGMSLALPAELNGYPGPAHSLELSEKLKLTADQKKRIEDLFSSMSSEAKNLGLR